MQELTFLDAGFFVTFAFGAAFGFDALDAAAFAATFLSADFAEVVFFLGASAFLAVVVVFFVVAGAFLVAGVFFAVVVGAFFAGAAFLAGAALGFTAFFSTAFFSTGFLSAALAGAFLEGGLVFYSVASGHWKG